MSTNRFSRSAGALCVLALACASVLAPAAPAHAQAEASGQTPPPAATGAAASSAPLESIQVFDREKDKKKIEKPQATVADGVTVTGSHINRADTETSQPVQTLTRKDLERTGITTVGDILQSVPSAGSALNTTFNNGGTGATEVDLRNLGSKRVLVLVDGHRWIAGLSPLSTSSIDLNTIPLAVVDRVDILQDGASAAYGSDAITGVINIITRKRSEGIQFSTQTGAYLQGDGLQQLHSLGGGHSFGNFAGNTSVYGSFSFQDQRSVFAGDRDISALPKINTGLTRGSVFLPDGRDLFVPNQQNSAMQNAAERGRCDSLAGAVAQGQIDAQDPNSGIGVPSQVNMLPAGVNLCDLIHVNGAAQNSQTADYRKFLDPADRYNYALTNYLSTPLRTYNSFVTLNHEFSDHLSFSAQLLDSDRNSRQELAPQPICVGNICPVQGGFMPGKTVSYNQASYIGRANPFNPFGQDIGRTDPNDPSNTDPCTRVPAGPVTAPDPVGTVNPCGPAVGLVGQGAILRRFVEVGSRIQEQHVPTQIGRTGLAGNFDLFQQSIDFEGGYSYGQSRETNRLSNLVRLDRLQQALGDGTCTAPCVPLNILGSPGSITKQMLDYVEYNDYASTKQKQSDLYLNLNTTIPVGRFLDGPLGIAFGVERRSSHYTYLPSIESITNVTSGLTSLPTDGAISAKETFLELNVPLLGKLPFVYGLELDLAGRFSDYGQFGSSTDGKVGFKYHPYRDLLLRGSFSTSFRAPDAGELYLGGAGSFPALVDPCVGTNMRRTAGGNIDNNCTADGVASSTTQVTAQILSPIAGNPNLKAENSHSSSFGVVFSPDQIPGLDMSVDYFKIILNNFINIPGGQFILDSCYANAPSDRSFCQFVQRGSDGTLQQVNNLYANFPQTDTSGVDYAVNWQLPTKNLPYLAHAGKFKFVTAATFVSSYNQLTNGVGGGQLKQGFAGMLTIPRWKINPSLQWSLGGIEASWNTRIIWHQWETCDDGLSPSLKDLGLCSRPNNLAMDGTPAPLNRVKTWVRNDIQLAYGYKPYRAKILFGVQNVLNQDPPVSYSSFANSYDPQYGVPGVLPYVNFKKDF